MAHEPVHAHESQEGLSVKVVLQSESVQEGDERSRFSTCGRSVRGSAQQQNWAPTGVGACCGGRRSTHFDIHFYLSEIHLRGTLQREDYRAIQLPDAAKEHKRISTSSHNRRSLWGQKCIEWHASGTAAVPNGGCRQEAQSHEAGELTCAVICTIEPCEFICTKDGYGEEMVAINQPEVVKTTTIESVTIVTAVHVLQLMLTRSGNGPQMLFY